MGWDEDECTRYKGDVAKAPAASLVITVKYKWVGAEGSLVDSSFGCGVTLTVDKF